LIWIALTIAAAVAVGAIAERRFGERASTTARRTLRAMLFWLSPPVVFFNMTRLEVDANVGVGIALGWIAFLAAAGLAYVAGSRVLRLPRPQTGALITCVINANTGYLGLPLVATVLGFDHLDEAVAFDTLVGAPATMLVGFAVGAAFGTSAGETAWQRALAFLTRNPPLVAAVLGLLAPEALAPDILVDAARVLVFVMLPMGFFAVGVALAEDAEHGELRIPPKLTPPVGVATALRLVVAPAILLALAAPLIHIPGAYLIIAGMPCGLNGLVIAHAYGLDLGLSAAAIAWSTTVAIVIAVVVTILV
jgi:predicted permease